VKRLCGFVLAACVVAVAVGRSPADPPAGNGQRGNPEAVFKKIDTNGDGKLSREEFRAFIEKATKGKLKDKPELVDKLFQRLDTDGDDYLTLAEFAKLRDIREKIAERRKAKQATEGTVSK
jgi:hypothetical protein